MWLFGMFSPPEKPNPYVFGFGRIGVLENSVKYSGNTLEFNIVNRTGVTMYDLTIDALEGSCQNGTVYVDYIGMENREEYGIMYAVKIANCDFKEPGDSFGVHLQIDYNETFIGNKISRSARGTLLGSAE